MIIAAIAPRRLDDVIIQCDQGVSILTTVIMGLHVLTRVLTQVPGVYAVELLLKAGSQIIVGSRTNGQK